MGWNIYYLLLNSMNTLKFNVERKEKWNKMSPNIKINAENIILAIFDTRI